MRRNYASNLHSNALKKEPPLVELSPGKAVVDRILAFSASYWTATMPDGVDIELILN
ncbi:MAG: hypothetical protein H6Q17_208 [Bacteroidetes bacterium]|jgi:hypothetical protein|nr:hypothetical protein [Bacteroidota bacterium]